MLLDSCVWGKALPTIAAAGHDAVWAGHWPKDPGDEEILRDELITGAIVTVEPGRVRVRSSR